MKKIISSALLLSFLPATAIAVEMPDIKAGLWEVDVMVDGQPTTKMTQCVDSDTVQNLLAAGQARLGSSCSDIKIEKNGENYVSSIECDLGVTKINSKTELSGDFSKQYVTETTTTFNPPMMGQGTSASKSNGTWVGPCKDGMKPGDTIMSDGKTMNLFDMMKKVPNMDQLKQLQNAAGGVQ